MRLLMRLRVSADMFLSLAAAMRLRFCSQRDQCDHDVLLR